jgi:gliding motility-associated-like protein
VTDDIDQCPATPAGSTVDANGCADFEKDTDGDGIPDDQDQCPGTPMGSTVNAQGCSIDQIDTDNDSVPDHLDLCPNTPAGQSVDTNGCADSQKDTDGDGITDDLDQCPGTPAGEPVDANGCAEIQKDTDGDGVSDANDQCPNTPAGSTVDPNGCADSQKDTDNDGVSDDIDQCPNTPVGESVDTNGCADSQKDTDGDGITDNLDLCPNTPAGSTVDANGCADFEKDTDGDGVTDDLDLCPSTPPGETVDAFGCSENEPTITQILANEALDSIEVAWGTPLDQVILPSEVLVLTDNGDWVNLPITWNTSSYDSLQSGDYVFEGVITLPNSWENLLPGPPTITVVVLAKPSPEDLLLSNDVFAQNNDASILIGDFTVIDPSDDVHTLTLVDGATDNALFEIVENQLFWNNSELRPGESEFTITVRVTDRVGNVLEKQFLITREILPLESLDIPNTFTPDGDGVNDEWGVGVLKVYESYSIQIYERGGLRVFFTDDANDLWDGSYLGSILPKGTYYFVIKVNDTQETRKGMLNLLRN